MATTGPHTLTWTNPTTNTDGSVYNPATDQAGVDIVIDGLGAVSVPTGAGTSFDLSTLAEWASLAPGSHTVAINVVPKTGVRSDLSAVATFSIPAPAPLKPMVATNLAVV